MTTPDCGGCWLIRSLPLVAWKWRSGLDLCSAEVWRIEQRPMESKELFPLLFCAQPWKETMVCLDEAGQIPSPMCDCIGYVVIATFTMTSKPNNQHTSQMHKAQETQAWLLSRSQRQMLRCTGWLSSLTVRTGGYSRDGRIRQEPINNPS